MAIEKDKNCNKETIKSVVAYRTVGKVSLTHNNVKLLWRVLMFRCNAVRTTSQGVQQLRCHPLLGMEFEAPGEGT